MQHLISFSLHYFAICFSIGLIISLVEKTNSDAVPNTVADVVASAASSVLLTSEDFFLLL